MSGQFTLHPRLSGNSDTQRVGGDMDGNQYFHVRKMAARDIATSLIVQAMTDSRNPDLPEGVRTAAREFLASEGRRVPHLVVDDPGIARAVINQAVADAVDPRLPEDVRAEASGFLEEEDRFAPFAKVAGIDTNPPMTRR